mmetsp:Transcript_60251/g.143600  ORF Transcript_60251/g.143600 Transcript_60251/m.143600 type:complete len:354 (+) Transcript_60251:90-1151(+)
MATPWQQPPLQPETWREPKQEMDDSRSSCSEAPAEAPAAEQLQQVLGLRQTRETADQLQRALEEALPPEARHLVQQAMAANVSALDMERSLHRRPTPPSMPPPPSSQRSHRDGGGSGGSSQLDPKYEPLSRAMSGDLRYRRQELGADPAGYVSVDILVNRLASQGWTKEDIIKTGQDSWNHNGERRFTVEYRGDGVFICAAVAASRHKGKGGGRSRMASSSSRRGRSRSRSRGRGRAHSRRSSFSSVGSRGRDRSRGDAGDAREKGLSKLMAKLLRHTSDPKLGMDPDGWVSTENLLDYIAANSHNNRQYTQDEILTVVKHRVTDEGSQRFEERQMGHGIYVRAAGGHTNGIR